MTSAGCRTRCPGHPPPLGLETGRSRIYGQRGPDGLAGRWLERGEQDQGPGCDTGRSVVAGYRGGGRMRDVGGRASAAGMTREPTTQGNLALPACSPKTSRGRGISTWSFSESPVDGYSGIVLITPPAVLDERQPCVTPPVRPPKNPAGTSNTAAGPARQRRDSPIPTVKRSIRLMQRSAASTSGPVAGPRRRHGRGPWRRPGWRMGLTMKNRPTAHGGLPAIPRPPVTRGLGRSGVGELHPVLRAHDGHGPTRRRVI
jgi:hypothetical protein